MSSIIFSPATEAMLNQPLTPLPTPLTNHGRLYPDMQPAPSPRREDGRQSRMSIRSPMPPAIHSPILERIISLPLRMSVNGTPAAHTTKFADEQQTTAVPSEKNGEETYTRWRPWTPVHARTPAISFPPSRPQSRSQSRSSSRTATRKTSPTKGPSSVKKRTRSPPPRYHVVVVPSVASTLSSQQNNLNLPAYANAVSHLRTPLVPLISVTTGFSHPQFPRSLLQYHLLTHDQLDSLARWYHQTEPPMEESWMYPAWIPPYTRRATWQATGFTNNTAIDSDTAMEGVTLTTKRRRWGRFIGLRGCESPEGMDADEQESLVARMERDWRRAMERAREEDMMREKGWRGRW
jgi:hypothetical protein